MTTTTPSPEKCWTCGETGSHHYHCPKSLTQPMPEHVDVLLADEGEIPDEDDFDDLQDDNVDMDRPEWDEYFPFGE